MQINRKSYRVKFLGGVGDELAGIIDRPDTTAAVPVAVLSHCFTCSKDLKATVRLSRGLAESGIACLRFDMTGLGGSKGDFSQTNFATNILDLRAAIGFAYSHLGPVSALLGHSFGGAASFAVASNPDSHTANLKSIVSIASPSETWHLADRLTQMNPVIETEGIGSVVIGGVSWVIRRQMVLDYRKHDLPNAIANIKIPTLLLHSPVDEIVGYEHAIRIMSLINQSINQSPGDSVASNPMCSLVSLEGANHLFTNDPRDIEFVIKLSSAMIHRYQTSIPSIHTAN